MKIRSLSAALAATLLSTTAARAQTVTGTPVAPAIAASTAAFHYPAATSLDATALAAPRQGGLSRPAKLMIFGGAALITGILIGDDAGTIIAVGGAVVGLYGLYLYLDRPGAAARSTGIGIGLQAGLP